MPAVPAGAASSGVAAMPPDKANGASAGGAADQELLGYLGTYGFSPLEAGTWRETPDPRGTRATSRREARRVTGHSPSSLPAGASPGTGPFLSIHVAGHREQGGHTLYQLKCSLRLPGERCLDWVIERRLSQLRGQLHDPVRSSLGSGLYGSLFQHAPFAHRGGISGTTSRLRCWFVALAGGVNQATLTPAVVCLVFRFLEVQSPEGSLACGTSDVPRGGTPRHARGPSKRSLTPPLRSMPRRRRSRATPRRPLASYSTHGSKNCSVYSTFQPGIVYLSEVQNCIV